VAAIAEVGMKRLSASRELNLATVDFRDVIMGRGTVRMIVRKVR